MDADSAGGGRTNTVLPGKFLPSCNRLLTSAATAAPGRTKRVYEKKPQTPYERLLESPDIPEVTKVKLRGQHEGLDPYELKKSIEAKLKKFFTALGNLDRESTKT